MDLTDEWLTYPGEDLARRIDIALALEPSTGTILAAVADWMSDVESTHAAGPVSKADRSGGPRAAALIRDEVNRVAQVRNRPPERGRPVP